jgi:hypothetical protein
MPGCSAGGGALHMQRAERAEARPHSRTYYSSDLNWQGRELMSRGERSAWIEPSADVPLRRDFRESEW